MSWKKFSDELPEIDTQIKIKRLTAEGFWLYGCGHLFEKKRTITSRTSCCNKEDGFIEFREERLIWPEGQIDLKYVKEGNFYWEEIDD